MTALQRKPVQISNIETELRLERNKLKQELKDLREQHKALRTMFFIELVGVVLSTAALTYLIFFK